MQAIAIEHVTRRYGSRRGIEDVSLTVDAGAMFGFLGPNGAGKTTTMRVLLGFLPAHAGTARVLGLDCWRDTAAIKRHTGYLAGDVQLWPWLDGRRAIRLLGALHGRDLSAASGALFERFELDPAVRVRAMSRGMRQKLGLVMALAHDPDLLILDEPTAGLDPLMQDELGAVLRERAEQGATVFFSSHTLDRVESLCERVAIVRGGRIVADAPLEELRARAHRRLAITWSAAPPDMAAVPADLRVVARDGEHWSCTLVGASAPTAAWAAAHGAADLVIESPDLAAIFRAYYIEGAEAVGAGAAS